MKLTLAIEVLEQWPRPTTRTSVSGDDSKAIRIMGQRQRGGRAEDQGSLGESYHFCSYISRHERSRKLSSSFASVIEINLVDATSN